jgi:outer membrane lipoprotein-sorting protein
VNDCTKALAWLIWLLAGITSPPTVYGYVPDGQQILQLMVRDYGSPARLAVTQSVLIYNHDGDRRFRLRETLKYDFPNKFRSDINFERTQRIHVVSNDEMVTVLDGKIETADFALKKDFDCYKDILLFRAASALQNRLSDYGINFSVSSLGRFRNKTVYIIGAKYPDITPMQIWLDKETFRPLRWIVEGRDTKDQSISFEIQYLEWQQNGLNASEQLWYPRRIQFYSHDKLVQEIVVDDIKVNPVFAEDFFNVRAIKAAYPPKTPEISGSRQPEGNDEIQQTIKEFRKKYE